jgi:mRNA interferase MazF
VINSGLLVSRTQGGGRLADCFSGSGLMTTKGTEYLTRVAGKFQGKQGQVVLDQIRTLDKTRLAKKLGRIDTQTQSDLLSVLGEMFSP